jgi:D-serine deaminase-like pyridoxal phosphate-dependent protein
MKWYELRNVAAVDSPALLIYPDRVAANIKGMIDWVGGDPGRLVPHVKTHKMREVLEMQLKAGISRFKCATIAELEMCLAGGAKWVLMTYQLTGPKIERYLQLLRQYPEAVVSSLVDNTGSAKELANAMGAHGWKGNIYIDLNTGFNRTGKLIDQQFGAWYQQIFAMPNLEIIGLHAYDGHIRVTDTGERNAASDAAFEMVQQAIAQIESAGWPVPDIIAGGSPTFTASALRKNCYCSPGTTLLWDWGYSLSVPELPVQWAALLLTRIISKPAPGYVTTDLGHKSVASENPIDKRVHFLNLENYTCIKQSEEHLVLEVANWDALEVGDVLYGVPYHVCPTVALYDTATIIRDQEWVEDWQVVARKRKITV